MAHSSRFVFGAVLLITLACRAPVRTAPANAESAVQGCWRLSQPVFRGLPIDTSFNDPPWSVFELTTARIGRYGSIRVLGAPGRRSLSADHPAYRLHAWRPVEADSIEVFWSLRSNAMEVRLAIRGDSATGEFFYHGDILLPGQSFDDLRRPPITVSAVRVRCPDAPAV